MCLMGMGLGLLDYTFWKWGHDLSADLGRAVEIPDSFHRKCARWGAFLVAFVAVLLLLESSPLFTREERDGVPLFW